MNRRTTIALLLTGLVAAGLVSYWRLGAESGREKVDVAADAARSAGGATGVVVAAEREVLLTDGDEVAEGKKPRSPYTGTQIRDAQALIDAGQIDEAIAMLTYQVSAFTKPLKIARAQVLLGRLLVGRGYLDEALALFKQAVASGALPPTEWFEAYLDVVRTYTKLGMMDEALAWVEKADAEFLAPGRDRAWFEPEEARLTLSRTLYNLGYYDIALEHAARISGSGSSKARQASLIEARALRALGRDEEARAALEKGIGENGGEGYTDVSKLYHELVKMVMQGGDTEDALALAARGAKAFEGSARYEDYMYFMGTLLRQHGISAWEQYAGAAATGDDARRRVLALEQLASSAARSGRWQDAARYYQEMINLPGRTGIEVAGDYLRLMDTQVKQGQSAQPVVDSLMAFLDVTEIADTATLHRIGKGLLGAGYYAEAEAYFQRVLSSSNSPEEMERSSLLLCQALIGQGKHLDANIIYSKVIAEMAREGRYADAIQTTYEVSRNTGSTLSTTERDAIDAYILQIHEAHDLSGLLHYFQAKGRDDLYNATFAQLQRVVLDGMAKNPPDKAIISDGLLLCEHFLANGLFDDARELLAQIEMAKATHDQGAFMKYTYQVCATEIGLGTFSEENPSLKAFRAGANNDARAYANFSTALAERLYGLGDKELALQLFMESAGCGGDTPGSLVARVYLGAEAFMNGRYDEARHYAVAITQLANPDSPISVIRNAYWAGMYIDNEVQIKMGSDNQAPASLDDKAVMDWVPISRMSNNKGEQG